MTQAILIAGNAKRFNGSIAILRSYLHREVGLGPKSVRECHTTYALRKFIAAHIEVALIEDTSKPLLIAFNGHGAEHGWGFDDARIFDYTRLADLLKLGKRPVLILNDCCHAMGATQAFIARGVSPERVGIIAASEVGEVTNGGLTEFTLMSWKKRRPNRYGPELRWGARHDELFFPKPELDG